MPSAKNFGYSLVATAPSPATSGTSLVVTAADGTKFPAVPFNATVWPVAVRPTTANAEIVTVTAISTDTLTIVRAQEDSSARTIIVGDQIAATITAGTAVQSNRFIPITPATQNVTLDASTDFMAMDTMEVGAGYTFELPATSTLEVEPIINYLVGEIKMFGGSQAPSGWFFCDGSAVSRTTYSGLFRVIGTTYGAGDGSTTFNLPDLRGRSPVGVGSGTASGATTKTLGSQPTTGNGGEETHTLSIAEMPAHTHPDNFNYTVGAAAPGSAVGTGSNISPGQVTGSTGGGGTHNIMHAMSVVNFIIKT